ncbi:NHL repeat-containing protein [Zavarzinella formosa]|uniref:hypothetical protein n=1 Tax=Zavarzinella formosa TaxID=360055 RepID=UPI0002F74089|nr:hypothetical protein [Zavarzinella formosa]
MLSFLSGRRPIIIFCLILGFVPSGIAEEPKPVRFLAEWGKLGDKPGEFNFPIGIAVNAADELLVTDHYNSRVQKFDRQGRFLGQFAVPSNPGGLAVDRDGNFYISHFPASIKNKDLAKDCVTKHGPDGKLLAQWGKTGTGDGEFDCPGGLAVDKEGQVYVADQTNQRVQVFDRSGKFLRKWGEHGNEPGQFGGQAGKISRVGGPQFVAIDTAGDVWTTEAANGRVQKFSPLGKPLLAWGDNEKKVGSFGGGFEGFGQPVKMQGPVSLGFDKNGSLWVAAVSGRVQQFSPEGKYLRGLAEGQGTKPGQFFAPHGLALDSTGSLYVVDSFNHRIQKFEVPR